MLDAVLDLTSIGSTAGVNVDAVPASVWAVIVPPAGTYGADDEMIFAVQFDKPVSVSTMGGAPLLQIDIGGSVRYAEYTGTAGNGVLNFMYVVQPGDRDLDGIKVIGLSAEGADIYTDAGLADLLVRQAATPGHRQVVD